MLNARGTANLADAGAAEVAAELARLYDIAFGGKGRGRYRISMKHLRHLADRRRLYADDIAAIGRALFELGFVLVDLDGFFVVLSQKTFVSYRRVNEGVLRSDPGSTGGIDNPG